MTLRINDTILYGTEGVCRIAGKMQRELGGQMKEYYVLKPLRDKNSTIYLPTDNEKVTDKIHRILSADEINTLIKNMPNEDTIWIPEDSRRWEEYRRILAQGDRVQLARLIRTLFLQSKERREQGKKLHVSDERILKEAESILYEEFAHVLDIKPEEVLPFILEQIDEDELV